MTYEDLQTRVVHNLGNRNNDETLAIIKARTNFVIEWLASQREWDDLQKTISGSLTISQYYYTLAELALTDLDRMYAIKYQHDDRWFPIAQVTRNEWNKTYLPNIEMYTGEPQVWCMFGGKIYFFKSPDESYMLEIDYYAKPTKVVDETSEIPFTDMDGFFEAAVTALSYLSLGEQELYKAWWQTAVPMIPAFNSDSMRILNRASGGKAPTSSMPWADPFRRK